MNRHKIWFRHAVKWVMSFVGVLWTTCALAGIDPQAEKGDAAFRDLFKVSINVGHTGIYYGYIPWTDNQWRHTVIQASGTGGSTSYAVDYRPFDDENLPPTFMGGLAASSYWGAGNRSSLNPATWNGSTNSMTAARRDAIITEAEQLLGTAYCWYWGIWEDSYGNDGSVSCEPRSLYPTYPTYIRCDGVVQWVYERVGFNMGDRTIDIFASPYPSDRAARFYVAYIDTPWTTLTETNTSFTLETADASSCPTIVQVIWGNGSTNAYWSPLTVTKTASSTIFYRGIDFANHTEDWKQFYFLSTYAAWKTNYFTTTELTNSVVSGDTANPTGDGIPNLMKYALALNPKVNSGSGGLPQRGLITTNSNNYLTLTYRRNASAVDITYSVESGGALTNGAWSTNGVTIVSIVDSNTFSLVTVRDSVPVSSAPCRFMRLRVTKP
jgi:hypothetical protein